MRKSLLLLLLFAWACSSQAQLIRQPISNFTPREFGHDVPANTYSIAECDNGFIYAGTALRVLQYDGVSWRYINVRVGAAVTSVKAHKGVVYLGSHGDFGFLQSNENGRLTYKSLAEQLSEEERNFSAIRKVLVINDTIVFQAEEGIFLYHDDALTIVKPETSFHLAFVEDNTLYVRERERGLLVFDGNKFNKITGSNMFSEFGVFAILPYSDTSRLIVTFELGLWEWNAKGFSQIELNQDLQTLIDDAELIGGIRLDDGNYALNSLNGGVLILDSNLNLVVNYTVNSGLLSSEVLNIDQDTYGNIWAATQKGVSRIQYTSPFSIFNQAVGLYGSVQLAVEFNGKLFVGTTEGLYYSEPNGLKIFNQHQDISNGVWAIEKTPNGMWIATSVGLWYYNGYSYKQINRFNTSGLLYIPENDWMVAAGLNGFYVIDEQTQQTILSLSNIRTDAYGIAYVFDSKTREAEIWMGSKTSGVWQITISENLEYNHEPYSIEDGLPPDWVCAYQAGSNVLFATSQNGMLRFVSPKELHELMDDGTDDYSYLKGYFDIVDFPKNSNDKAITAFQYDSLLSYSVLDYHVHEISMKDSIPDSYKFKTLELGRLNVINKEDGTLLVGGDDGLAIVNNIDKKDREYPIPDLNIRSITIGNDSIIWYGDTTLPEKQIVVPYSLNNVEVQLASNYFDNGFKATYSWRIKGTDEEYSRWSPQSTVSLPNLREGEYELLMVAKNIHGDLSNEVSVVFKVLPPWYRTWWAYTFFAIIAAFIVYGLIQYNIRRLKEQNKKLEEIVKARTKEVVEQKEHIESILQEIQSSINYAQRIQQALLPSNELLKQFFPNHFIVFHPRDVVSGDFYWATQIDKWSIVTAADCTGHGVPGAFMSMLGISFLNEIVRKKEVVNSAQVIDRLRDAVIEALKQTGKQNEQKDGMDMSIAAINPETRECLWAGANNPLLILRKKGGFDDMDTADSKKVRFHIYSNCVIKEIRADKMPVAIHTIMKDYTNHSVQLLPGDRLYLFTDGFPDQFGGPNHRKFMAKRFKELIASTSNLPINEQGDEINRVFESWKNYDEEQGEQIDDVTVLGIEV
ncbi:MAG: SpoIIE family protein phosphatase [Bacteroidales bacterium]